MALVLSGGGARTASHLGALEVLLDLFEPTCVVGASAGALIGLLVVLGYSPQEMVGMVKRELSSRWLRLIPGGDYLNLFRLLRGGRLARRLRRYCPADLRLESLSPRLVIECADLVTHRDVLLDAGPAIELVVASCSLPLFGRRYVHQDMVLMDPCLTDGESKPLAQVLDVDLVVAIQSAWPPSPWSCPTKELSASRTFRGLQRVYMPPCPESAASYDLVIAPVVPSGPADLSPRRIDQLVRLGRNAAREKLPQLTALLDIQAADCDPRIGRANRSFARGDSLEKTRTAVLASTGQPGVPRPGASANGGLFSLQRFNG